jgi:hypothetical protein
LPGNNGENGSVFTGQNRCLLLLRFLRFHDRERSIKLLLRFQERSPDKQERFPASRRQPLHESQRSPEDAGHLDDQVRQALER